MAQPFSTSHCYLAQSFSTSHCYSILWRYSSTCADEYAYIGVDNAGPFISVGEFDSWVTSRELLQIICRVYAGSTPSLKVSLANLARTLNELKEAQ